ncbi:hypothetical protein C8R44DRAFT_750017 [Mycena epipterygia]|nr:hypothetical protein C8R44DRAFT_750017 [Mycena epipterygia]
MLAETENSELPIVSRLYDEAAPVLEHLNLFVNDVDSECLKSIRRTKSEQILTKGCPLLTVLRMRGLPMHFFCPPLTNITTLYLEQTRGLFLGYRRFVKLLTASPVLAHLSIQASVIDESEESWPPESRDCISVLNLVSLRLAFPGTLQQSFSDVLGSVCAPRLQSLVLKAMGEMQLDNFLASPAVAAAKFPALRSLALCDFDYHSNMRWAAICAAFPHITDFIHFYTTTCPPRILSMLAGLLAEWPSDTWPNLQTLTVTLDIDDLPLVQDAVAHRKKIGHPIPVLRVFETVFEEMNDGDEEILNWLEKNTMVERLMTVDRWPPGSDYDPDDIFVE